MTRSIARTLAMIGAAASALGAAPALAAECGDLAQLALPNGKVTAAEVVAAGAFRRPAAPGGGNHSRDELPPGDPARNPMRARRAGVHQACPSPRTCAQTCSAMSPACVCVTHLHGTQAAAELA